MDEFKHIHFDDPQDFIAFLEPENKAWFNNQRRWIFRGQAQADWGLHSKLAREIINNKYTDKTLSKFYWEENSIVNDFIHRCREIGLELPIVQKSWKDVSCLDFDERLHISALGQHYGLPTRMLDWTRNRWNALFFALDTLNHLRNYSRISNLSIWCLDTQYTESGLPIIIEGKRYKIKEFYPSFHKNKNAISQLGIFTYMESEYDRTGDRNRCDVIQAVGDLRAVDINHFDLDFVLKNGKINFNLRKEAYTIGYKLTISRKHFDFLESWLSKRLINYYNLFPDYQGAALNSTYCWKNGLRKDALAHYKSTKRAKRPEVIKANKKATEEARKGVAKMKPDK